MVDSPNCYPPLNRVLDLRRNYLVDPLVNLVYQMGSVHHKDLNKLHQDKIFVNFCNVLGESGNTRKYRQDGRIAILQSYEIIQALFFIKTLSAKP
jgi:hypothetical protein